MPRSVTITVDNASGTLVTPGPITTAKGVKITRVLDGPGIFDFSVPLTDERSLAILQNERRVRIRAYTRGSFRTVGEGIVREQKSSVTTGINTITVSGPDTMDSLRDNDTGRSLIYREQTLETVINDLLDRVGWTATYEDAVKDLQVDARFDGTPILKSVQRLAKNWGVHLRLNTGEKSIAVGYFGQPNGLRVINTTRIQEDILNNQKVLFVERISIGQSSSELVNRIEAYGSGTGVAQLTLEKANLSLPYPIKTGVGNLGETIWYMEDEASIAEYGLRKRTIVYGDITPVSNTDADIINAANVLARATATDLGRLANPQQTYEMTLKNVTVNIQPGDIIHVRYKGLVYRDGKPVTYIDVNSNFWILKVIESVGDSNSVQIEVNSVDYMPETPERRIVEALNDIRRIQLQPDKSTAPKPYVYPREIAPTFPASVPIEITNSTLYLNRVRFRLTTTPFRATAKAAEEGGDHRHLMFQSNGSPTLVSPPAAYYSLPYKCSRFVSGSFQDAFTTFYGGLFTGDLYTFEGSGTHTHELEFGITDDNQYPRLMTILVDGVDRTAALAAAAETAGASNVSGGVIGVSNAPVDFVLDEKLMTQYIIEAAGGMRQRHTVEIQCSAGQGRVEATIEVFDTSQSIEVKE